MSIQDGTIFGTKQELINAFKNNTSNQWLMNFFIIDISYTNERNFEFKIQFSKI